MYIFLRTEGNVFKKSQERHILMAQAKAKGTEWRGGIRDGQGRREVLFEESYGGCKAVFNVMDEGGKGDDRD